MSTEAQITANRANAKLSTRPSSAEGKAKASLNAVKTGLTGRTVVLPSEDVEVYQKHVASSSRNSTRPPTKNTTLSNPLRTLNGGSCVSLVWKPGSTPSAESNLAAALPINRTRPPANP